MFIPRCNKLNVRTSVAHLKYYIVHLLVISFVVMSILADTVAFVCTLFLLQKLLIT